MLNGGIRPKKPDYPSILDIPIALGNNISHLFPSIILSRFFNICPFFSHLFQPVHRRNHPMGIILCHHGRDRQTQLHGMDLLRDGQ